MVCSIVPFRHTLVNRFLGANTGNGISMFTPSICHHQSMTTATSYYLIQWTCRLMLRQRPSGMLTDIASVSVHFSRSILGLFWSTALVNWRIPPLANTERTTVLNTVELDCVSYPSFAVSIEACVEGLTSEPNPPPSSTSCVNGRRIIQQRK